MSYEHETVAERARFLVEEARESLAPLFGSPGSAMPGSAGIPACVVPGEDQLPRRNGPITTEVVTTRLFWEESDVDDCDWPPQSNDFSRNGAVTTKVVTTRLFWEESDADDCDWPSRRND